MCGVRGAASYLQPVSWTSWPPSERSDWTKPPGLAARPPRPPRSPGCRPVSRLTRPRPPQSRPPDL